MLHFGLAVTKVSSNNSRYCDVLTQHVWSRWPCPRQQDRTILLQLYQIACNSLTTLFSFVQLAGFDLLLFCDEQFVMLGPKRQTVPVTVCLHSTREYQSLHCVGRSRWEQNLLPDPFLYLREENLLLCPYSLSRSHYTVQKGWKLTSWDNWGPCCHLQTERQNTAR